MFPDKLKGNHFSCLWVLKYLHLQQNLICFNECADWGAGQALMKDNEHSLDGAAQCRTAGKYLFLMSLHLCENFHKSLFCHVSSSRRLETLKNAQSVVILNIFHICFSLLCSETLLDLLNWNRRRKAKKRENWKWPKTIDQLLVALLERERSWINLASGVYH